VSLHVVHLRGIPVELHQQATAAGDALRREFTLLVAERDSPHDVPARLLALADELTQRFATLGDPAQEAVLAAAAAGRTTADAVYEVPPEAVEACERLRAMLAEADEYCRQGDELLTLAPSEELIAYRHWFLDQFAEQVAGRPARAWADVAPRATRADEPPPPVDSPEVVIPLSGAIDLETCPPIRSTVAELRDRDVGGIVFDLADVTFIDSVGLSLLVSVHRRLRDEGGHLTVSRPSPSVRQVLEMTGLMGVLDVRA
jgi:anti-anti-sigma factor